MATPVSILLARYRAKYSFDLNRYRPQIDSELVTDRNRMESLYAGAGLGATGLALRGIPHQNIDRAGALLLKTAPVTALGVLGAGVAMDKNLLDTDPVRVGAGVGLAGAGTGLMLRGLENSLRSVLRPGAGNLILKSAPLMALAAGGTAYARDRRDDFGEIV